MQPENLLEIMDLARTLRQEQLFIQSEQTAFRNLNDQLSRNSSLVCQLAWICAQQRQNLSDLITSRPETGPSVCCQRSNKLENTKFVDAFKAKGLKYEHTIHYIELFNYLYRSPYVVAKCLSAADGISKISQEQLSVVVSFISTGLYGNGMHSKDIEMLLKLLRDLIEIQIVVNDNPRRMLRAGSSAFARLYHRLHESMFSSKIFLTAALYEPLMRVLVHSDALLEVDIQKVLESLPQKERVKLFGEETDPNYESNLTKHQEETIDKLYTLANSFIESITKNWSLFPSTLRWLVQTMNHQLKLSHISEKEINEIITDMVFTHFICATIVSPDLFGISDAPISEESRFNLIQIGQIIQMLALMKYNSSSKFDRLYKKFKPNAVSRLLDTFMVSNAEEGVMAFHSQQIEFERSHVLCTQSELNTFTEFLRNVLENDELIISGDDRRQLGKVLNHLPDKVDSFANGDGHGSPTHSTDGQSARSKNSLINLGKSTKNKLAKTMSLHVNGEHEQEVTNFNGSPVHVFEDNEQIIMFPITISDENALRPLTEEEVLKMNSIGQDIGDDSVLNLDNIEKLEKSNQITGHLRPLPSKNTRFSISHDDASIGNSDNLEAVSEAPSNHSSVTSSLELEENDQNDNLSDMVSANVSGRGSPNISGRDTPSSQVTDGESVNQIPTPQMAKIIQKNRSDIDDKFCKFEIRNQIQADETVSIVSDTWSTDVLASDSETVEPSNDRVTDRNFSTPLIPAAVVLPGDNNFHLEVAECRSESNWSTDVLASDSEKLAEIDTDDNQSITARSDITDPNRSNPPDSPFFAPRHSNSEQISVSQEISRFLPSVSSLARSSDRATNQYTGENNFQQNYKSSNDRASSFLAQKSAMRRQHSAESSISNQSYSLDEARTVKVESGSKIPKDLIDFGDFQEEGGAAAVGTNEGAEAFNNVVHRRVSSEQRSSSFDGRRNGVKVATPSTSSAIFHKFENHEVVLRKVNSTTTTTTIRNISTVSSSIIDSPLTDDLKSQQQQQQNHLMDEICVKTEDLSLSQVQTSTPSTSFQATKPTKSTGAIPKSISFDASADKSMMDRRRRNQQQDPPITLRPQGSSGLFNKIKQGFRRSRNNNSKNQSLTCEELSRNVSFVNATENVEIIEPPHEPNGAVGGVSFDINEDILEKYRRKVSSSSEATNSDSTGLSNRKLSDEEIRVSINGLHDTILCFGNIKKKIRTVLSETDQHTVDFRYTSNSHVSPLLSYLQIQLAQALNLQNFEQIAYISEAIRCVSTLDDNCQTKILEEIQADVEKRQSYLQYLMRYRQNLLLILESIEQYENRLTADREMSNRQLIVACIRMFLEKQENMIVNFQEEFSSLSIMDEKLDLLEEFVEKLMMELREGGILYGMVDWQLEEARVSIERILLHRLYKQVMFPNEDVDLSRDKVLHDHIRKLRRIVTPSHTALRIPQEYLNEAPWPFAQQQISYISAYKTPREKLQTVIRCISSITTMLRMANDREPATDDLLPVLIYVIIMANPPYLLSTIEYINCFIGSKLEGLEQFYWTQFCSVVQFIKTLDYLE